MSAALILLIVALVCWFIAAIPPAWMGGMPVGIGWLGLFFYGLSQLVGK
jgi:hypothetical protein